MGRLYATALIIAVGALGITAAFYGGVKWYEVKEAENTVRVIKERDKINEDVESDDDIIERAIDRILRQSAD